MANETELVKLLGTRFIQRRSVKAFQSDNGAWYPDKCEDCRKSGVDCPHRPMTMDDFRDHFAGRRTMGHYLIDPATQTCKLFAFDIDVRKPDPVNDYNPVNHNGDPINPREVWLQDGSPEQAELIIQVRALAEGFAQRIHNLMQIPVAIATSGGKGLHVYGFTGEIPAEAAFTLAQQIMESWRVFEPSKGNNFWRHKDQYPDVEIETFPKQTEVSESGFGNLMSLPLGINRKTKREKFFVSTRSTLDKIMPMDPIRALEGDLPWE